MRLDDAAAALFPLLAAAARARAVARHLVRAADLHAVVGHVALHGRMGRQRLMADGVAGVHEVGDQLFDGLDEPEQMTSGFAECPWVGLAAVQRLCVRREEAAGLTELLQEVLAVGSKLGRVVAAGIDAADVPEELVLAPQDVSPQLVDRRFGGQLPRGEANPAPLSLVEQVIPVTKDGAEARRRRRGQAFEVAAGRAGGWSTSRRRGTARGPPRSSAGRRVG